jgi:alanine dehydrogenase
VPSRARPPRIVDRDDLATMRPGAVVVDISIDQGG